MALSKKLRFAVFKRDNFTCQYCGGKAPDVILQADHVRPVAGGGPDDILNLITSCQPCNSGKGARELSDHSAIQKQRQQLEELNQRREQLEMMIRWRENLVSIKDDSISALDQTFLEKTGQTLTATGKQTVSKWLRKYTLSALFDALDTACDQYGVRDQDGKLTQESILKIFNYVPRICAVRELEADKPYIRDLFYVRGILRSRCGYVDERYVMVLLESAVKAGVSTADLKQFARDCRSWTDFRETVEEIAPHG